MKLSIIQRAENQVRQQLFGGILLIVAGWMVSISLGWAEAGNNNAIAITFTATAGTFSIDNVTTSMAFAAQVYGAANNILGNSKINSLAVTDYRGNAQAWTVAVNANNLSDGTHNIIANKLNCYAANGTVTNLQNGLTNKVAKGTSGTLNGSGITLVNGSSAASGIFQYDDGVVRLTVNGHESSGNYASTMVYTLS